MRGQQRYFVRAASGGESARNGASAGPHVGQSDTIVGDKTSTNNISGERVKQPGDEELAEIYRTVTATQGHNFRGARVSVPSGLCVEAWRKQLQGHADHNLPDFLEFDWPIHCQPTAMLTPTWHNHPSARQWPGDIEYRD